MPNDADLIEVFPASLVAVSPPFLSRATICDTHFVAWAGAFTTSVVVSGPEIRDGVMVGA
jgi:hypothetical protein